MRTGDRGFILLRLPGGSLRLLAFFISEHIGEVDGEQEQDEKPIQGDSKWAGAPGDGAAVDSQRREPALSSASQAVQASDSDKLRSMIDERLGEGERILKDVEAGLDEVGESPGRRKNVAAEGLIGDVREHVQEVEAGPALDAVLIAGLQKTEHYCIAAWGTAKALAKATGQSQTVRAMERALKEGGAFDERLTELAEQEITPALLEAGEGSEMEESAGASQRGKNSSERRPHA